VASKAKGCRTWTKTSSLTTSQVDLLKADSVASGALPGLRELDIPPNAVDDVVPIYIGRSLSGV
jgi:hypothetical protein